MKYIALIALLVWGGCLEAYHTYAQVAEKLENLIAKVADHAIGIPEALLSVEEQDIDIVIKPSVIPTDNMEIMAEGRAVCTGAAQGVLCFNLLELSHLKERHGSVIWVTDYISNDDLCYLQDIAGIFALKEDPSSHAMIVTRVASIPCLATPQNVTREGNALVTATGTYREGDLATLDGFNGKLLAGFLPLQKQHDKSLLDKIMTWSDQFAKLVVHGNADTDKEAELALSFGAKGVDPRTEHMFFHPERLHAFRKVILSKGKDNLALEELAKHQKADFIRLFQVMQSYPAKIRLLDPPLHEFLTIDDDIVQILAQDLGVSCQIIRDQVDAIQESNPMMGNRGVRLLLTFPEILKMQARTIFEASLEPCVKQYAIEPYINIPMVISAKEVLRVKEIIQEVCEEVQKERGQSITYHLGVMIETPRACLLAAEIAPYVDFISFGTNDLTAQTLALSRGDVYDKFLEYYLRTGLLDTDPFSELDPAVIQLMQMTITQMRQVNSAITIGICGEQASEKKGIFACSALGCDTVSCAPTRIPAVKLFAAQAALSH